MRKKLNYCFFIFFIFCASSLNAQMVLMKKVTGIVRDTKGQPLSGINVQVNLTGYGTITKDSGNFTLSIPRDVSTLVFSGIGYQTKRAVIGLTNKIDITMSIAASDLDEVIVTGAYGKQQSRRSTSYNAQVVTGAQLNTIREVDFNNALAGKVAGLQVRSQSAAKLGQNSSIRLRGATGFSTGSDNSPIYIVDGTILPDIGSLNQDDVEDVNILQGPAAGAIYGSQGANGAIVITTKKGKKNIGLGVELNLGTQLDYVMNLPKYQNLYAGGSSDTLITYHWQQGQPDAWKALDGKGYPDYSDDASWGPKMEGQEYIPWYAWYGGTKYSYKTASLVPQPNNAKEFYNVGVTSNNSVSFSSNSDKLNFRMSYQNTYVDGMVPTQSLKKNNLNVVTSYILNKYLEVSANITYNKTFTIGEITDGYANLSTGSFNQWFHRDLDMNIMKELQNLKTDDGVYASWNHLNPTSYSSSNPDAFYGGNYWYNPYTYLNNLNYQNNKDRYFGNVSMTYKVNDDLKFTGTYRKNYEAQWTENTRSSDLQHSATQTGVTGYYYTQSLFRDRQNMEFLANYHKHVNALDISAMFGGDFFRDLYKENHSNTNGGLTIDNLYTIANSVNTASIGNDRTDEKYHAIFGNLNLGYNNYIFLNGTLRKDWYSTLPETNNAVLSKSIGGSFVFTNLTKNSLSWLSFGKVRASWGEVPKALGTASDNFGPYRYPGSLYTINSNKWNGNQLMYTSSTLVDPNIHGAVSRTLEMGLDLSFFKDRVTFSGTYFNTIDKNFPYTVTINGATGYTSLLTNIGEIQRTGFEFSLGIIPIAHPNFNWKINANWAPLFKNDVIELSKEYDIKQSSNLGAIWGTASPSLYLVEGQRWGQLIGGGKTYDKNGNAIVSADGKSYVNNPTYNYGSVLPKHTGGIQNNLVIYKRINLNVNVDWQIGGKFASLSESFGSYSGLTARTAAINDRGYNVRDDVNAGGGVHVKGVTTDGTSVDTYVDAQTYYHNLNNNSIYNDYVYDLTFIKLREISLGYSVPIEKIKLDKVFRSATISLVARNLWLIYNKTHGDFDPSEISNVYGESANLPGSRSFGINFKFNF